MISAFRGTVILAAGLPAVILSLLFLLAQLTRGDAPVDITVTTALLIAIEYLVLAGLFFGLFHFVSRKVRNRMEMSARLQREIASEQFRAELLSQPRYQEPKRLGRFAHKAYSQFGEDGMIAEIFARIGTTDRHFVEFGFGDGSENNAALLLTQGWTGLWLDADDAAIEKARSRYAKPIGEGRLQIGREFITAENIESLFDKYGVPGEWDLLSIDIDRNDYYVWQAITRFKPRVMIVEFNSVFPPPTDWVVEYAADRTWDGTSRTGASLKALERLGREKGYSLVGCNLAGVNAFFVRDDLVADQFCEPFTAENHFEPPRYWLAWGGHHRSP